MKNKLSRALDYCCKFLIEKIYKILIVVLLLVMIWLIGELLLLHKEMLDLGIRILESQEDENTLMLNVR